MPTPFGADPANEWPEKYSLRKEVGDFYNANFINLKLDMESEINITFRQKYPVSAFPTLFYIDSKGKVLRKVQKEHNNGRVLLN